MKASDIKVSIVDTFKDFMIVGEGKEVYLYEKGKKTDIVEFIGYPLFSSKLWEKVLVKIKEVTPSLQYEGNPVPVTLINPEAKVWFDYKSNEIKVSVIADGIQAVQNKLKVNRGDKADEI